MSDKMGTGLNASRVLPFPLIRWEGFSSDDQILSNAWPLA